MRYLAALSGNFIRKCPLLVQKNTRNFLFFTPSFQGATMDSSQYLPFVSNFIRIENHKVHYLDEGSGPVVLLLHGNPTWCYYYRHLIEKMRSSYRLVAVDMVGCGLSDHPQENFRASDRIRHLVAFIDALKIDKFSMVLHDWGGPIGTGAALQRLDKLEKIVYLNTTLTEIESLPSMIKTAAAPFVGKFLTQYTTRFLKLLLQYGVHKKLSREVRNGYLDPYRTVARRRAIWGFVQDIPFSSRHPTYQTLNRLASDLVQIRTKPVQIIWGLKDPCFHKEMLEKVAAHFPSAEVHEFTDASHLVLEDKPTEVTELIKSFFDREISISGEKKKRLEQSSSSPDFDFTINEENLNNTKQKFECSELFRSFCEHEYRNSEAAVLIEPSLEKGNRKYQRITRGELLKVITKYQRGLAHLGLRRGDRVLFLIPAGFDFLALTYATLACGAIPVFVDPGVGRANLLRCIEDTLPDAFISIPKGHLLKLLSRRGFRRCRFHITVTNWLIPGVEHTTAFLKKFSSAPIPAQPSTGTQLIAFTSGATGTPKGVVYSDSSTIGLLNILRSNLNFEDGDVDMPLLPIFSLFNVALGVTTVFPPMDAAKPLELDPEAVLTVLKEHGCNSSFGSPTLWQKIGEYCIRSQITLPQMKRVLIAGAPVSDEVLVLMGKIMNPDRVFTPYGSTEALPVTLLSATERRSTELAVSVNGELGTLVGKPIPGVKVKVIKLTNAHLKSNENDIVECAVGEIGEIIISGLHVSPSYLNRPDAVKKGKINTAEGFWHRMGDVGYFDEHKNLYFCGRLAHMVSAHGKEYSPIPVERIVNQHAWVKRSALVCLPAGAQVGIVVEPFPEYFPKTSQELVVFKKELEELCNKNALTHQIEHFFFHHSFPVDGRHNAKIFRDKLGEWATGILKNDHGSSVAIPVRKI
jgi:olefin beta-lactone synthetase